MQGVHDVRPRSMLTAKFGNSDRTCKLIVPIVDQRGQAKQEDYDIKLVANYDEMHDHFFAPAMRASHVYCGTDFFVPHFEAYLSVNRCARVMYLTAPPMDVQIDWADIAPTKDSDFVLNAIKFGNR